jgi:hypothetical protein
MVSACSMGTEALPNAPERLSKRRETMNRPKTYTIAASLQWLISSLLIAKSHRFLVLITVLVTALLAVPRAEASDVIDLDGSFSYRFLKPTFAGLCPSEVADECGIIQLDGLGAADWAYVFGPTFEPTGEKSCFYVDGTFTLMLHSDGSTISGPLTGVFCSRLADPAHQHAGSISWGNPFIEDDSIQFIDGTGQFAGLYGTASFRTFSAGAVFEGSLTGTLSN